MYQALLPAGANMKTKRDPKSSSERLPPRPLRILEVLLGQELVDSCNLKGNSANSGLAHGTDRSAPQALNLREAGQKSLQDESAIGREAEGNGLTLVRGTILQYSGENGSGRVVSNGSQFSFKIQQWKGSSAPTLNKVVEVEILGSTLVSVSEVPEDVLLQEKAGEAPEFLTKLGRQSLNLWRLSVTTTGRVTVLAQITYAISLFQLPAASFHLLWFQMRKREGSKKAREKLGPVNISTLRPEGPLDVLQMDHTPVDVIVVEQRAQASNRTAVADLGYRRGSPDGVRLSCLSLGSIRTVRFPHPFTSSRHRRCNRNTILQLANPGKAEDQWVVAKPLVCVTPGLEGPCSKACDPGPML